MGFVLFVRKCGYNSIHENRKMTAAEPISPLEFLTIKNYNKDLSNSSSQHIYFKVDFSFHFIKARYKLLGNCEGQKTKSCAEANLWERSIAGKSHF